MARARWRDVVELVAAIGDGRLDDLGGRYFRAGADTAESLLRQQKAILDSNARVLRLAPMAADDPAV